MSGLRGRLVLITGASAGIGRASARAFVEHGARVLATARNLEKLEVLSSELGGSNALVPLQADVTDSGSMRTLAARVLDEFGTPDVVLANAGVGLDARFVETTDEALAELLETNVTGVLRTVRPFLRGMIERGSGRVLIVSSIVGKRGIPHYAGYSASKHALHGMADALRSELLGSGVTVGLICPSSTATEFQDRAVRHGPGQRRKRPRRSSAESVAGVIVRMARSRRREIILTPEAKLMAWANFFVPGLLDRVLARVLNHRDDA